MFGCRDDLFFWLQQTPEETSACVEGRRESLDDATGILDSRRQVSGIVRM